MLLLDFLKSQEAVSVMMPHLVAAALGMRRLTVSSRRWVHLDDLLKKSRKSLSCLEKGSALGDAFRGLG